MIKKNQYVYTCTKRWKVSSMKIKKNFVTLTSKKPTNEICRKENVVNADDKE